MQKKRDPRERQRSRCGPIHINNGEQPEQLAGCSGLVGKGLRSTPAWAGFDSAGAFPTSPEQPGYAGMGFPEATNARARWYQSDPTSPEQPALLSFAYERIEEVNTGEVERGHENLKMRHGECPIS